ncbi:MAG: DEAD/DEAH box helicase [Deltaproteobacteria bacterium]|nr:DEAD/DEAH box helicase [Deltaproteobacteria bacterium]
MNYAPGALVTARGRDWVVLPESDENLLVLRPLGGSDAEIAGVYLPLEAVKSASFDPPSIQQLGDHSSCRLLRDAVRLGFRSSAGPFRSFARLAVEPRPYQLVPLLMALKLDPVRLLIADDVGIGKTVEAGLIARELLDRGEVKRLCVLCPPPLAEQWQRELLQKFHIEAELVLASTASRLEKSLDVGESLFEHYPFVVVSMDFIKSDRRRDDFLRSCPELVIVDEAHSCAFDGGANTGRHQRHQLLKGLAKDESRHLVLVTATPHSGKEGAFRSLLGLLRPEFEKLSEAASPKEADERKRELAKYVVQRRRGDLKAFLDAETPFPKRESPKEDPTYLLTPDYRRLFDKVLEFARETVQDADDKTYRQRIRWWAALGLLRALASSPAAAAMTLRNRAAVADTDSIETADELGRITVLDPAGDESAEGIDVAPGGLTDNGTETETSKRLRGLAAEADALGGKKDSKLQGLLQLLKPLIEEGFSPIVFCRFIPTADYVAEYVRKALKSVEVMSVTGQLPPEDREARIAELAAHKKQKRPIVLVATDCLSEGINLQEHFDAVVHYDLAWNPTRHEQREGRVDRYGQVKDKVRVITYYGKDNRIDGIVLDVLIKKHKSIRNDLGISVPVPTDPNKVMEAIFEGLLLKRQDKTEQGELFPEAVVKAQRDALHKDWQEAALKQSQTVYAQIPIKVDEVARELQAIQSAIGAAVDVERFVSETLRAAHAVVGDNEGTLKVDLKGTAPAIREAVGEEKTFVARFELPVPEGVAYLQRTHPVVERLANHVLTTALDAQAGQPLARRCGVIQTDAVQRRTTLLLARFRFHILTKQGNVEWPLLAEDCLLLGFRGAPQSAEWLPPGEAEKLLFAKPGGNVFEDKAKAFLEKVLDPEGMAVIGPQLARTGDERGKELLDAHRRVRESSKAKGVSHRIQAAGAPDLLGVFLFLPNGAA